MSQVLDELRVGEKVSEGRFRIDSKRALEKLRKSRLADPSHWVLDVLRAAQASGAQKVVVRTDADDVEVTFDGRAFPAAVMKNLLAQALGADEGERDARHRLFALGIAGAMGVGLQRLLVESGKVSLSIDAASEVTLGTVADAGETSLKARKRLSLRVAGAWFGGLSPEERAVTKYAVRYGPKLLLDGKPVTQRPLPPQAFDAGGIRICAQPRDEWEKSEVDLDVLGVFVARKRWALPGLQLEAVVQCDGFRRNASGTDVVDDDPNLKTALGACRAISLELLREAVKHPTDALRERIAHRLMHEDLDPETRSAMVQLPLFPGPAGERHTLAALQRAVKDGAPLHLATGRYPKGSYPEPTVLMNDEARRWETLLPGSKREDVAAVVRRNLNAAENRLAWEAQPPEAAVLPDRDWLATCDIDRVKMKGQVGIEARGSGAFVRLLAQGRFLQQGEVAQLAPLRLRAVVDLVTNVSDKMWAEIPNPKLWSTVVDEVAHAAQGAIASALKVPAPDPAALMHARELLQRHGKGGKAGLPREVLAAPLFECLGGARVSLDQLGSEGRWRYVTRYFPHPPLDTKRVMLLGKADREVLAPFADGRLSDVTDQLEHELDIHRRLAGAKHEPVVKAKLVSVPFDRGGMRGEVAISADSTDRLALFLYRDGFELESTTQTSRYGPAAAAVECAALVPSADWTKAVRDGTFDEVMRLVREHERLLAPALLQRFKRFNTMPLAAKSWLLGFAKKELDGQSELDGVARAVFEAKLLDGPEGPISLAELKARAGKTGTLWLVPAHRSAEALKGQAAAAGDGDVDTLLHLGTGFEPEDGGPQLERIAAREQLLAKSEYRSRFDESANLFVSFSHRELRCRAALALTPEPAADVVLLVEKRKWRDELFPAALPLRLEVHLAAVDDPSAEPDDALHRALIEAVGAAQQHLLALALDEPERPGARRALWYALASRLDSDRLLAAPLFECTDGVTRAAEALAKLKVVRFVTARLEGAPRDGKPVVLALDEDTRRALGRFEREDVTQPLAVELKTRAARLEQAPVEQVRFGSAALLSRALHGAVEGEVAIAPSAEGRLVLLLDRRPLCAVPGALPLPLAAAVNSDALRPSPAHDGVLRDAAYREVIDAMLAQTDALAADLAARWSELSGRPGALEAALRLCALLGPKKRHRAHPLLHLELLAATDGRRFSVAALLDDHKKHRQVWVSEREGALLEANRRRVWRTDWRQRRWLDELKLEVKDVTGELERADRVRSRPKVEALVAPLKTVWRERLDAGGVEGEVALPDRPTKTLAVELHQGRSLLERYQGDHAVGASAAVNFDELTPNPSWTKAARNPHFRTVMKVVETGLGRLLARRLMTCDEGWREWAEAAVRWNPPEVAPVLPSLELFEALDGRPVTVGAVLAEYARARRVAVASGELHAKDELVLADSERARELLEALGVTVKDVSEELIKKGELEADRQARRLEQLAWPGDALARVKVSSPGVSGELALPASDSDVEVTLAKEGVRVQALPRGVAPGVAGVVDIAALGVDETWTRATLSAAQRATIEQAADELLEQLCRVAPSLSREHRLHARRHVLRWLERSGVSNAVHVDRLTGVAASLATAGVFETAGGEVVGFAALAAEVRRRGRLAVFARSLFRPDTGGALALWVKSFDDEWLVALEKLLGPGTLERVKDAGVWRAGFEEEDPPPGSPELWALSRLRRDARLLNAGALGQLMPEDLEGVRLEALGGKLPVHYDAKRRLVLLDSEHAQVKRALAEAKVRRERLYVLLAAMYGAINRALDRVTDQHEEDLVASLAAHLAANPQLLEPEER